MKLYDVNGKIVIVYGTTILNDKTVFLIREEGLWKWINAQNLYPFPPMK